MKHLLPFIIFLQSVYKLLETFCSKTISQVSVTCSLNNRKLSAPQNTSDPSPEYSACKIQTEHTVPYLYWQDPECFPSPCWLGCAGMCGQASAQGVPLLPLGAAFVLRLLCLHRGCIAAVSAPAPMPPWPYA